MTDVEKCIAKFVNNIFVQKPVVTTVPKLELRIVLPYLGSISIMTRQRLNRCIVKRLKFCKLKIIFQTGNRLRNYSRFKDCVLETLQSNFVYKWKCGSCTSSYYDKTYRCMKVCVSEHQGVSPGTGKTRQRSFIHVSRRPHVEFWRYISSLGRLL